MVTGFITQRGDGIKLNLTSRRSGGRLVPCQHAVRHRERATCDERR
jgi:hypothetical protein